jgi:hypothetical protein
VEVDEAVREADEVEAEVAEDLVAEAEGLAVAELAIKLLLIFQTNLLLS